MEKIDEKRLEQDHEYRFDYICKFINFGKEEINCILDVSEDLVPKIPQIVDAIYEKLFEFNCTKRHFVMRHHGYQGELPASLKELSLDHAQIYYRKRHLNSYLKKLLEGPYNNVMVLNLNSIGKIHTNGAWSREIHVPLTQMTALMGFLTGEVIKAIIETDIEEKSKVINAFNKLLWIQNNLIVRHYVNENAN